MARFGWPQTLCADRPLAIAHRGASAYRPENTLSAFRLASDLAAELWELDMHLSADGVCVVAHDDNLQRVSGEDISIAGSAWNDIRQVRLANGERVPRLEDVIALAGKKGSGLYIEIKAPGAGQRALQVLRETGFRFAALGSFCVPWIAQLREAGCEYPLAVLVPAGADPFDHAGDSHPDILHLCWREAGDAPHRLLSDALLERCIAQGMQIVSWHEERLPIVKALLEMPLLGICSDRPEVLKPCRRGVDIQIVCHRGANFVAPENTLEAARICLEQGFHFVEFDVRTSADGELVVIHDPTLDRTTDAKGPVDAMPMRELMSRDAGGWYRRQASGMRLPSLSQILDLLRGRAGAYVEIKKADPAKVIACVSAHGMLDSSFFWSPDTDVLRWLRRHSPDIVLMAQRSAYGSVADAIADYDAQIIEFAAATDDLSQVRLCREAGVRSMIFSLSHNWRDLESILAFEPDLVNLDRPDRFKIIASYPQVHRHFVSVKR